MPSLPGNLVPSAAALVRTPIVGFLRSMLLRNMNAVVGDYIIVAFDSGERFQVNPGEILRIVAEDTSPENTVGKIHTDGILFGGNGVNTVTIECNYTAYTGFLRDPVQKTETR